MRSRLHWHDCPDGHMYACRCNNPVIKRRYCWGHGAKWFFQPLVVLVMLALPALPIRAQELQYWKGFAPNTVTNTASSSPQQSAQAVVPLIVKPAKHGDKQAVKNGSPWNLSAKLSVVAFGAAMIADCTSTSNLRESNGLLRNGHGQLNQGLCFGLNSGVLTLTLLLQKKYPRGMNWLRWIGAGAHGSAAIYNERIKQ